MTSTERWQGPDEFKECVRKWAARIEVEPRRVQIQKTAKKWGSCSAGGTLTFSADLLAEPKEIGEAVIVHELIHLKVPNHGPVFKSLERAYLAGKRAPNEASADAERSVPSDPGDGGGE